MNCILNKKPGSYTVVKIEGHGRKFYELGIIPGSVLTLLNIQNRGPITVRLGNSKIAIGRQLASSIFVI
uniref:FeoA family protein n=1 Tax=Methanococcus maripaludis (strain C6 / ATCC BAA-1332) TaxID=444158 RepID=A9A797_METM6